MIIKTAEFFISNARADQCPDNNIPEYAFIGRSNVGKSSLINCLTGNKKLAMTSSTPGKTLLINHFLINKEWFLVDLPGYGFAKRGKKEQEKLFNIINYYVMGRKQLTLLFVLIDSRLEPQKIDLEFIEWLGENEVPFSIIFTKSDKSKSSMLYKNVKSFLNKLHEQWEELPKYFISSSEKGIGRDEILNYIESINQQMSNSNE